MSAADTAALRPTVEQLEAKGVEFKALLSSLERRIEEAIATNGTTELTVVRAGVHLRGLAVEVGGLIHQLNSFQTSIVMVLDEMDRLVPIPAANDTGPKRGGRA